MREAFRSERDTLGAVRVPRSALYGAQTRRAVENFPISGLKPHPRLVWAYAALKKACAETNAELGTLDARRARALSRACAEVLAGRWAEQFVVDPYQAGAGTSLHMNVNEVLANRASELLGGKRGDYRLVHPNDHANMAQSTNDTFPTAAHVAVLLELAPLDRALAGLAAAFLAKGTEFSRVVKSARTHLQDAVPITLGQEFRAYGAVLEACRRELARRALALRRVALGGTAAGTGANAAKGFRERALRRLSRTAGLTLSPAADPRAALQSHQPLAAVSSALKELALELVRISNDLRLLASGPATGLAEIRLPAVQPGSSIMPGKVNPSLLEAATMVAFQVAGRDLAVSFCAQAGQLDLNVMTPLAAHGILDSIGLLARLLPVLDRRCVRGISADRGRCRGYFEASPSLAALLNPKLGYARSAAVFKEAAARGVGVRQVVLERGLMTRAELDRLLDPKNALGPLP